MTDSLKGRCELFVGNQRVLKKAFKFETMHTISLCSYLYANEKAIVDPERINDRCKKIRKKCGALSSFASFSLVTLSTLNSLDADEEIILSKTFELYKKLRRNVRSSSYLSLAAYLISKLSKNGSDTVSDLTVSVLETLKRTFPKQRFSDDILYAVILALSGKTEADLLRSVRDCTLYLSSSVSKPVLKQLAIVCTISGDVPALCCQRFITLRAEIEKRGIKLGKRDRYTLLHVFTLACIKVPERELADLIFEVYDYLNEQKCFGFGFGYTQRLVYSILHLYGEYIPKNENNSDPEIRSAVKSSVLSAIMSVSAVISAEISWSHTAISVI